MITKKVTDVIETFDIDLQLVATELDTSVVYLLVSDKDYYKDGISLSSIKSLFEDIANCGGNITSFDDYTDLVEFNDIPLIYHRSPMTQYIIFDKAYNKQLKEIYYSYK